MLFYVKVTVLQLRHLHQGEHLLILISGTMVFHQILLILFLQQSLQLILYMQPILPTARLLQHSLPYPFHQYPNLQPLQILQYAREALLTYRQQYQVQLRPIPTIGAMD